MSHSRILASRTGLDNGSATSLGAGVRGPASNGDNPIALVAGSVSVYYQAWRTESIFFLVTRLCVVLPVDLGRLAQPG